MAGKTLDFTQIIFDESQREHCYPFAKVYFNETLTDYFENSVLCDLVPNSQADLISVCSWRLAQKRGDCYRLPDKSLTEQKIMAADFDIAVLTPRSPTHKMLLLASEWHRVFDSKYNLIATPWDDAFKVLKPFLKSIGINVPDEVTYAIQENHFIAKRDIYHEYVEKALKPAMEFVRDKDVFYKDSGYVNKKKSVDEIRNYQTKSGRTDWPILPFILERLFSIWIEGKGFKVINL